MIKSDDIKNAAVRASEKLDPNFLSRAHDVDGMRDNIITLGMNLAAWVIRRGNSASTEELISELVTNYHSEIHICETKEANPELSKREVNMEYTLLVKELGIEKEFTGALQKSAQSSRRI